LNPFKEKGIPLEQQVRTWKDIVQPPYEKQTVVPSHAVASS
jgi:hypothetical protein